MSSDSSLQERQEPVRRRLVDVLRAVPATEIDSLVRRLGIPLDPHKRLDIPAQVARSLVALPEIRDTSSLPAASLGLLRRLTEEKGSLLVNVLPKAVEPLAARGIVFVRLVGEGVIELILPSAYVLQLRSWEGEDPRGIRALLVQASFETLSAIASHYLGRPSTPPMALALEPAWEVLSSTSHLNEEMTKLSAPERRLLDLIEQEGGEVDTEELLDLEREPMRLRNATGATPSRRGVGFALERRGFLISVHPNRHVIPTEIATIVGSTHHAERAARRSQIRENLLDNDYHPRRARFADDPWPVVMAMALSVRESTTEIRSGIGTPRSLMLRMGQRFGRNTESVSVLGTLSRAAGLWDVSALAASAPPGAWHVQDVSRFLFDVWRRGGAWDEARPDPEVFRLGSEARDASPLGVLREMLLDALRDLGEERWVPWRVLADYVRDDSRTPGVARLLRRWAKRTNMEAPVPVDVVRRIAFETLPALGILDLGDPDSPDPGDDEFGSALRLTARGRVILSNKESTVAEERKSSFLANDLLEVGGNAKVASVLALAPFVEVRQVIDGFHLGVSSQLLAQAISSGLEIETVKTRFSALCTLSSEVERLIEQASAVLARVSYGPAAGFLWIQDDNVRDLLASRRQTADLFVDPSPPNGLLIAPGIETDRLVRKCRLLGIEILYKGETLRITSSSSVMLAAAPVSERKRGPFSTRR